MKLDKAGQPEGKAVATANALCCRLLRQHRRHLCSGLGGTVHRAGCAQSFGTFGVVKACIACASCATQRTTAQASETGVSIAVASTCGKSLCVRCVRTPPDMSSGEAGARVTLSAGHVAQDHQ